MSIKSEKQFLTIRELTAGGLFAALIAVGAFIKITLPTEPVPMHFTLQWFFVLLAGLMLNKRLAGVSVGVYLLIGLAGVPVFASGGGPSYLLRPGFGYLLGFAASAYLMAWMCECFQALRFGKLLLISAAGLLVYYGLPVSDLPGGHMEDPAGEWIPADCGAGFHPVRGGGRRGGAASRCGQRIAVWISNGLPGRM